MKTDTIFYDKEFRNKVRYLDQESLTTLLANPLSDVDVKVLTNTKDTFYFIIPDNSTLGATDLSGVQAAGVIGASTVGSHSTLGGTASSATSTIATLISTAFGSASTLGCMS